MVLEDTCEVDNLVPVSIYTPPPPFLLLPSFSYHQPRDLDCVGRFEMADLKWPSMLCHNPDDGGEVTAAAELLGMGFWAALGGRIQQLVHPQVEDELQQLWHLQLISVEQLNGKISGIRDGASFIIF